MKEALKRAAQALGLASAPAQAEDINVTTEAVTPDAEVVATVVDAATGETVEMVTHTFEAPANAASYHQVVTELHLATHSVKELGEKLETVLAELEGTKAALAALQAANAQAAAEALATKLAARKEAIVAALGTERADAFMEATKDMPDGQFTTVMAAMTASAAAEATKPEFTEVGVDAQADVDALQAEAASNGTLAILKAKYQQKAAD